MRRAPAAPRPLQRRRGPLSPQHQIWITHLRSSPQSDGALPPAGGAPWTRHVNAAGPFGASSRGAQASGCRCPAPASGMAASMSRVPTPARGITESRHANAKCYRRVGETRSRGGRRLPLKTRGRRADRTPASRRHQRRAAKDSRSPGSREPRSASGLRCGERPVRWSLSSLPAAARQNWQPPAIPEPPLAQEAGSTPAICPRRTRLASCCGTRPPLRRNRRRGRPPLLSSWPYERAVSAPAARR